MASSGLNRTKPPAIGYDIGEVFIAAGSFVPTGAASNPATATMRGDIIESVTHAGTGLWDVVLRDVGYQVQLIVPSLRLSTTADSSINAGALTVATRTFQIRAYSGGALSNLSTNDRVEFAVYMTKTGVNVRRN